MNDTLPTVLESTTIFDNFFVVTKDRLRYPNQTVHDYFVLHTVKQSVAVIATTPNNEIVVTKEYRHAAGRVLLGCPGGLVDEGEEPLEAAERELLEETGFKAKRLTLIGSCFPLPGVLSQTLSIVHAEDVTYSRAPQLERQELIEWQLFSQDELKHMLQQTTDVDAILCSSFFFYQLHVSQANSHASRSHLPSN